MEPHWPRVLPACLRLAALAGNVQVVCFQTHLRFVWLTIPQRHSQAHTGGIQVQAASLALALQRAGRVARSDKAGVMPVLAAVVAVGGVLQATGSECHLALQSSGCQSSR